MIGRLAGGRSEPASTRRLDPQRVARCELSLTFRRHFSAVEQVSPAGAVATAVAAPRGDRATLGDQA